MISYTKVKVPEGSFKLSPSGLAKFRSNPKEWLLNMQGKSTFNGNFNSVQGTCIHYIFESKKDERTRERVLLDIALYLEQECDNDAITMEESSRIQNLCDNTFYDACNNWLETKDEYDIVEVEPTVCAKVPYSGETENDYYIAGSIDAIVCEKAEYSVLLNRDTEEWRTVNRAEYDNANNAGVSTSIVIPNGGKTIKFGVRDYKTSTQKQSDIDKHKIQLMTYALAWNATHPNQQVSFIEMVNVYNTKTKGVQINSYRYDFTAEDITKLLEYYNDIVVTHQTSLKYPQISNMLFREGGDFRGRVVL